MTTVTQFKMSLSPLDARIKTFLTSQYNMNIYIKLYTIPRFRYPQKKKKKKSTPVFKYILF